MTRNCQVRFGGGSGETDQSQGWHGALLLPYASGRWSSFAGMKVRPAKSVLVLVLVPDLPADGPAIEVDPDQAGGQRYTAGGLKP